MADLQEGPLLRRTTWGRWQKCYVRMVAGKFCVFAKMESTTPLKTFSLEDVLIQNGEQLTKKLFTFGFFRLKKKTEFFQAKTNEELNSWLQTLKRVQSGIAPVKEITLEETLESMNDAVVISDEIGTILEFNHSACEMFGWPKEKIIGQNVKILTPKHIAEKHDYYMKRYQDTGKKNLIGVRRELTAVKRDGSFITVEISLGELRAKRFLATFRSVKRANTLDSSGTEELAEKIHSLKKANDSLKIHNELLKSELKQDLVFTGNPKELFTLGKAKGKGSYGVVFKALHKKTKGSVAIKIIKREVTELVSEIDTLSKLSHPNVVQYFGCYVCQDETWIVMEYCSKGSVSDAILENHHCEVTETHVAAILKQLLHGIEYMHKNKSIHRDIKSANLLLTGRGDIKVADFSIAGTLADDQKTSTLVGSPCFMAPEIFKEEGYDASVDIWAVGITAIELAERKPPFKGMSIYQIMMRFSRGEKISLKKPKKWSQEFNHLVNSCLQYEPKARPTAKELLHFSFIEDAPGSSVIKPLLFASNLDQVEES
eukprot:TRINITY_DN1280_c0_g1_i1.p1 TRINITY_DN1280_c0_g1~~TRINITY_DN1280_c0_g1_i1.p1  ORF type:complete len:542 (+),score=112.68 TRINITY_DN1280_c0_g1_i1:38-1663(+)